MLRIGILGPVAAGKSAVAAHFAALGAGTLDADRAGHQALGRDDVRAAIRGRFGDEVFAGAEVDRRQLAARVFGPGNDEPRRWLESLTHPHIARALAEQVAALEAEGRPAAVLDAALLLEAGWDALCDKLVYVEASAEECRRRAAERGWTAEELAARQAAQWPAAEKRRRADAIVDNNGAREAAAAQVLSLWNRWVAVERPADAPPRRPFSETTR